MIRFPVLLAQQTGPGRAVVIGSGFTSSPAGGVLIVLGSLFLVVLISFLWAVCLRRTKRHHKHRHHQPRRQHAPVEDGAGRHKAVFATVLGAIAQRRSRRQRREHRRRNPTLAETGGLPPHRQEPSASRSPSA